MPLLPVFASIYAARQEKGMPNSELARRLDVATGKSMKSLW
jgi:hypothetical protein